MTKYYLNANASRNPRNDNEVHKPGCNWMSIDPVYLGEFDDCIQAVEYAKTHGWPRADGCKTCCKEAHTG